MPNRLHRLERIFQSYPIYFATLCTHERRRILANQRMHEAFLTFARNSAKYWVSPGRYVLMPDHLHVLVAFAPDAISISKWVKSLKNTLSKALREQGIRSPHWQKDFFDHVIRSEESYCEKYRYIRENPVTAALVQHSDDWPFQGEVFLLGGV
jgi:REP-associated tyrosine transposase